MDLVDECKEINKLFNKYRLDPLVEEPIKVEGGLLHEMYKVTTKTERYAVKKLNPIIMKREGVLGNIKTSESLPLRFDSVIPAICALEFDGELILRLEERYYIIFEWVDAESIFPPNITVQHCETIGNLLGKIHASRFDDPTFSRGTHGSEAYGWNQYLESGIVSDEVWVDQVREIIDKLHSWTENSIKAKDVLSCNMVLSHRDLDPKNIMWNNNKPYIIDWEAAGFVNPYQELLEVINYWAVSVEGELERDKFDALISAYKDIVGDIDIDWSVVLASGFSGMLGWLDYSFKRALGIEANTDEESILGSEQVIATIFELKKYEKNVSKLALWLVQ